MKDYGKQHRMDLIYQDQIQKDKQSLKIVKWLMLVASAYFGGHILYALIHL